MENKRNQTLQELCREYLGMLRIIAKKYGLDSWLDNIIKKNSRGECEATETEVEMLSRCVDDERITRLDIPEILGKSYRGCVDDGDFDNPELKKLPRLGIYSRVSALLYASTHKKKT
jgi:hypothetical protein